MYAHTRISDFQNAITPRKVDVSTYKNGSSAYRILQMFMYNAYAFIMCVCVYNEISNKTLNYEI